MIIHIFLNSITAIAAQRLAAQALGRLCNIRFILPETSSMQVAIPLAALGQVA